MKIQSLIAFTAVVTFAGATNQPIVMAEEDESQLAALENETFDDDILEADEAEAHDGHHGHEGKSASGNEEYGFFGVPWAVPDFVVGLAMGAYGPVNARTRDGDCFSKWYDWGLAMVGLSDYFTKSFDVKDWQTWVSVVLSAGTLGSSTYFTIDRCLNDLDVAKQLHWNHHYGFKAEDVSIPQVGLGQTAGTWATEDHSTNETAFTVGMVVALVLGGLSMVNYALSGYYYWGFGLQLGYFVSNLVVGIDYWGDYKLFHPEPAYERYLPTDH